MIRVVFPSNMEVSVKIYNSDLFHFNNVSSSLCASVDSLTHPVCQTQAAAFPSIYIQLPFILTADFQ